MYHTLTISIQRVNESLHVDSTREDPQSEAGAERRQGLMPAERDLLERVRAAGADDEARGKALGELLFASEETRAHFLEADKSAQASGSSLRLVLRIDPSAHELQTLRWELTRHPETGALLSTSERIVFSRLMVSRDWRPVRLRARGELRACVAVSAPPAATLAREKLAAVDFEGESGRVKAALSASEGGARVALTTIGGPGDPFTVDRLLDEIRRGVDIVYIVSHGKFSRRTGMPVLYLQDRDGELDRVKADELARRMGELQQVPRLVVLASCQSGGDGTAVQPALAGRLADAGVPAVVAMQGFISMDTVEVMMPKFFAELLDDGQIDRAMAASRALAHAERRPDFWMPALYMRLASGRIWYVPGFKGRRDGGDEVWRKLLPAVREGRVVPLIGPGLLEAVHGSDQTIAHALAERNGFPFAQYVWDDLPRVSEFVSVKESRFNLIRSYKEQVLDNMITTHRSWLPEAAVKGRKLVKIMKAVAERLREEPGDAYRILAGLPASVYVTTNYDYLLEWALAAGERRPQMQSSRWRHEAAPAASAEPMKEPPSEAAPMVYHAFGVFTPKEDEQRLVLSEDDYFDYLIESAASKLIPDEVGGALVSNSLLFLGFRLTDWHFRVLFRLMMSLEGRDQIKRFCHVAVQLEPDSEAMVDAEAGKRYLEKYFGYESNIDIYWGSAADFLVALNEELERGAPEEAEAAQEEDEDDDEWFP